MGLHSKATEMEANYKTAQAITKPNAKVGSLEALNQHQKRYINKLEDAN
ncbi:TPA: hypothetical protein ACX3IN_004905 [Vibrio parahaemolyticus]